MMIECSGCGRRVSIADVDASSGLCLHCQAPLYIAVDASTKPSVSLLARRHPDGTVEILDERIL